jgi:hypothetical protein
MDPIHNISNKSGKEDETEIVGYGVLTGYE